MKLFVSYFGASIVAGLFVLALAGARYAMAADSLACYSIQNSDSRAYCIARAKKEPALCYNVQDAGMRSMCLAEVRK